jgi:hypothetical protein
MDGDEVIKRQNVTENYFRVDLPGASSTMPSRSGLIRAHRRSQDGTSHQARQTLQSSIRPASARNSSLSSKLTVLQSRFGCLAGHARPCGLEDVRPVGSRRKARVPSVQEGLCAVRAVIMTAIGGTHWLAKPRRYPMQSHDDTLIRIVRQALELRFVIRLVLLRLRQILV